MILPPRTEEERDDTFWLLQVINMLRQHGPGYNPPFMGDAPHIRTRWPKPQYL